LSASLGVFTRTSWTGKVVDPSAAVGTAERAPRDSAAAAIAAPAARELLDVSDGTGVLLDGRFVTVVTGGSTPGRLLGHGWRVCRRGRM
jgi:hypothetical protein